MLGLHLSQHRCFRAILAVSPTIVVPVCYIHVLLFVANFTGVRVYDREIFLNFNTKILVHFGDE